MSSFLLNTSTTPIRVNIIAEVNFIAFKDGWKMSKNICYFGRNNTAGHWRRKPLRIHCTKLNCYQKITNCSNVPLNFFPSSASNVRFLTFDFLFCDCILYIPCFRSCAHLALLIKLKINLGKSRNLAGGAVDFLVLYEPRIMSP